MPNLYRNLDLGLPSLRNCEKYRFVAYKPLSLDILLWQPKQIKTRKIEYLKYVYIISNYASIELDMCVCVCVILCSTLLSVLGTHYLPFVLFPAIDAVYSLKKLTLLHSRLEIFNAPLCQALKLSSVSTATTLQLFKHSSTFVCVCVVLTYTYQENLLIFDAAFISFTGYISACLRFLLCI